MNAALLVLGLPCALAFASGTHAFEQSERTGLLRRLTESSGGRLVETNINDKLEEVFRNVLLEIETCYLLTYRPPEGTKEGWHDIKVELKGHKAAIRARSGFYYKTKKTTYE